MKVEREDLVELCNQVKLIPVLVIDDTEDAMPLAQALLRGGLNILEVTLRTTCALDAIQAMSRIEGITVGAGTILTSNDMQSVKQAGAAFAVTPGTTSVLFDSSKANELPLIPGVATVSEAMKAYEKGYSFLKFFPAESSGGVSALSSFAGPLKEIKFCPTGGISVDNAPTYLGLDNVICVGGSWVAPKALVKARRWDEIEQLATQAKHSFAKSC